MKPEGKRTKKLYFYCSPEEHDTIEKFARANERNVSGYCREIALQGAVVHLDYNCIREHTNELSRAKAQINAIVKLFAGTNGVYQSDIEELLKLLGELRDTENELLREFNRHALSIRKYAVNELKKSVDLKK